MRLYMFLLAICICQMATHQVQAEGQYAVIGPGTIHSARPYNVAVTTYHTTAPTKLKVGITGPSYNETKTLDLSAGETSMVTFDVPAIKDGTYNLTAEGLEGIVFKNTTKLNYAKPRVTIKIQTDKGLYNPGDVINFRVLFLDENLKPAKPDEDRVIYFEDSNRNRVKEIKNFEVVKGVYTGKYQVSEYAPLGHWSLSVEREDSWRSTTAYFEVNKHVLPKFVITMDATDTVAVQDGDMQVIVRANYTYGKPFNGKVTLIGKLSPSRYHFFDIGEEETTVAPEQRKEPPTLIKTADMVNGKAKFEFNIKHYEEFMESKKAHVLLHLTANVKEDITGVTLNASTTSTIYPYRYHLTCISYATCGVYLADTEFEVITQIRYIDNTIIKDTKAEVKLVYKEKLRKTRWMPRHELKEGETTTTTAQPPVSANRTFEFTSHMNESGIAVFKVTLPELEEYEDYFLYFDADMFYAGEKHHTHTSHQYREPKMPVETPPVPEYEEPKDYFKVTAIYDIIRYSYDLGDEAVIRINSSEPLSYFVYDLIARGNIQHHERVELPDKPKVYEFKIKTTFIMAPFCKIYIQNVDDQGNFHYAETSFSVEPELQNKIEITAPTQVKPGDEVQLKIKTAPHSFVGLLAVDKSVLDLRENNDFHPSSFRYELHNMDTTTPWQGGYSTYPGDLSGCVTLTNAHYPYNYTAPEYMSHFANRVYSEGAFLEKTDVHLTGEFVAGVAPGQAGFAHKTGVGGARKLTVRKDFSETWLFTNIEDTQTDEFTLSKKIPDTITKWKLSAFSVNPEKGFGVTPERFEIVTFQDFFLSIRLPYSVKRGEVFNVPIIIFNYLAKELKVDVTLDNADNEFEFTDASNEVINESSRTKSVVVPPNAAAGVSFMIRPTIIGNIMLKVTAISPIAGDAVHKTLKVVPEGVTEYANRAYFVNLKDSPEVTENFELELPQEIIPDSQHVEFGVTGDILGPSLNNLEHLIRMPMGCGEQVVSQMVPNLDVYHYLKSTGRLTPELESKIKRNIDRGYQRLQRYKHEDGSFSSFGPATDGRTPRNGSTWLTAYVLRTLTQAKNLVLVDDRILSEGFAYLLRQQAENGSFLEKGDYYYMTRNNEITLTANVLQALTENKTIAENYSQQIEKGFKIMTEGAANTKDLYAKAVAFYTARKAQHESDFTKDAVPKFKELAKTEGNRMWWSDRDEEHNSRHIWWCSRYSSDIETTSYILLALLDTEYVKDCAGIATWLVSQRNSYGGFISTQDTRLGLQALMKFAIKSNYEVGNMNVQVTGKGGKDEGKTIEVNDENAITFQNVELPPKTNAIEFTAKGKGVALIQIAYQYNVAEKEKKPSFTVETSVKQDSVPAKLEFDVCVEYVGEGETSNMAVLEVSLPSGYTAESDAFDAIYAIDGVRQVETKNSESTIVVYFESLKKNGLKCLPIEAFKSHAVALLKPAPVVLYDYYDNSKKATNYYQIDSKLCDICVDKESEECKACK